VGDGWREKKRKGRGSLHDIIDILSQNIKRLRIDIGISDKRAEVDYPSALLSHRSPAFAGS
jgi:hypothetical protein